MSAPTGTGDDPWASNRYLHLARADLPVALAELHRSLDVGARVELHLLGLGAEQQASISGWQPDELRRVVEGAGFGAIRIDEHDRADSPVTAIRVTAERALTLPDYVSAGMRLLLSGLNPSIYSAQAGVGFARPGNRFWPAMTAAGLCDSPRDPRRLLRHDGIGMTDLVKRATAQAAELDPDEYRSGVTRLRYLVEWLQPGALGVIGLTGWRAAVDRRAVAGVQPDRFGGRPVYLMPNTSGRNAHSTPAQLCEHLRAAALLGGPVS